MPNENKQKGTCVVVLLKKGLLKGAGDMCSRSHDCEWDGSF